MQVKRRKIMENLRLTKNEKKIKINLGKNEVI